MNTSGKIKKIGIVFNLKKEGVRDDEHEEYDEIDTIESLRNEIEKPIRSRIILTPPMEARKLCDLYLVSLLAHWPYAADSPRSIIARASTLRKKSFK